MKNRSDAWPNGQEEIEKLDFLQFVFLKVAIEFGGRKRGQTDRRGHSNQPCG